MTYVSDLEFYISNTSAGREPTINWQITHLGHIIGGPNPDFRVKFARKLAVKAATVTQEAVGNPAEDAVSQACKYPRVNQAEIVSPSERHPVGVSRPEWSGYCTDAECEDKCHKKEVD